MRRLVDSHPFWSSVWNAEPFALRRDEITTEMMSCAIIMFAASWNKMSLLRDDA
jgi:hypothetical protein